MREQWGSQGGFIVATIGASVGLGNIWRFSYVAGENGGATFLFVYLICVIVVGLPLVIAELSLGRHGQGDAIAAFEITDGNKAWKFVGWISIAGAILILSYYAVIAGWALKYFVGAVTGGLWNSAEVGYGNYFKEFISHRGEPIAWQATVLFISMFIIAGGVQRGIELVNRWLMPTLAIIIVGLAIYAFQLPNWSTGAKFLFSPDWSALTKPSVYAAALGQAFFSLGIGMAVFITYGSYMPKTFSLPRSATAIVIGDSLFAVIAGLAIFPAVFSFGGDPTAGPELAFIALPQIFVHMTGGLIFGIIFFFLLASAAITSMVSLLEVPVSMMIHRFKFRRWSATASSGLLIFAIGLPSAMSFGTLKHIKIGQSQILDAIDIGVSNFILPIGGICIALFIGWHVKKSDSLHASGLQFSKFGGIWLWLTRTIVPLMIALILFQSASAV